jgi:hypothetical protein
MATFETDSSAAASSDRTAVKSGEGWSAKMGCGREEGSSFSSLMPLVQDRHCKAFAAFPSLLKTFFHFRGRLATSGICIKFYY